jgi:hypothetical protein
MTKLLILLVFLLPPLFGQTSSNARRLQGRPLAACPSPANGDTYIWNTTTGKFECAPQSGAPGPPGTSILSGTDAPTTEGSNGDFYIQNPATAPCLYGPKSGGEWPETCVSLIGSSGDPGEVGPVGPTGPVGGITYGPVSVIAETTAQVDASVHGAGANAVGICFDNSEPAEVIACSWSRNAIGDIVFTWSPPFTGSYQIFGAGQTAEGVVWTRLGTTISPTNAGDTVNIGSTNISPTTGIETPIIAIGSGGPTRISTVATHINDLPGNAGCEDWLTAFNIANPEAPLAVDWCTPVSGEWIPIDDGATPTDSTVGGGGNKHYVYYTGSDWVVDTNNALSASSPLSWNASTRVLTCPTCAKAAALAEISTDCDTTVNWAVGSVANHGGTLTLTGACNLTVSGMLAGGYYIVLVTQGTGGSHTLDLGTGGSGGCAAWFVGGDGSGAVTPTTAEGAKDVLAIFYDGTNCYANYKGNFN